MTLALPASARAWQAKIRAFVDRELIPHEVEAEMKDVAARAIGQRDSERDSENRQRGAAGALAQRRQHECVEQQKASAEERDSWIYRSYEDPHQTAGRFAKMRDVRVNRARVAIEDAAGRIKRAMKNVLKRAQSWRNSP